MSVARVVVENPTQAGLKVSAEGWSREEKLHHVCPGIQHRLAPAVPLMQIFRFNSNHLSLLFNFANDNKKSCMCSVIL